MMTLVEFIVLALATWRLTSILMTEEGPFFVFVHLRHWVGVRYNYDNKPEPFVRLKGWKLEVAKVFVCQWCLSVWVGLFFTILFFCWGVGFVIALPLACSAVTLLYDKKVNSDG